ncbi:NrtR DNA-binding winged helix domain-containing protein [Janibacter limosus]|uniref:NrtR DNA-binding winged helix domain-containing protein n=1 Tax=Janibacter limosus TaxID=53458 RepID=UPI0035DFFF9E
MGPRRDRLCCSRFATGAVRVQVSVLGHRARSGRVLAEPFTLHQLRKVHEAIVGEQMHKDNFVRRMKPYLEPVIQRGEVMRSTATRGRPAMLYRKTSVS